MQSAPRSSSAALVFIGQLVIALSIIAGAWLLRDELRSGAAIAAAAPAAQPAPQAAPEEEEPTSVADWARFIRPHNPAYGPADAPVTIIEFSDFECPFCARHYENTHKQLIDTYGDKIRLVFKHFPLPFHGNAKPAGVAAQCAHREGKFWPMHDVVFENFRSLGKVDLLKYGKGLGLGATWASCFENNEALAEVEADLEDGRVAGVRGTPTFLINGQIVPGAMPFERFKVIIDGLL